MNIDTLLEAAKYVDSVGAAVEHSFTRGNDDADGDKPKEFGHYSSPILEKQLAGSLPSKQHHSHSVQARYNQPPPSVAQPATPSPASLQGKVQATTPSSIPVSIIQHTTSYPPLSHSNSGNHPQLHSQTPLPPPSISPHHHVSVPYHLHTRVPHQPGEQHMQQHPPLHLQHAQHPQRYLQPQHPHLVQQAASVPLSEQQQPAAAMSKSPPSKPPVPSHTPPQPQPPPLPSPIPPPSSSSTTPAPHMVTPQQAIDLLHLAKSQDVKYTTLTAPDSPRGGHSPSNLQGSRSPRLVHQIVSHNQWVAGERPTSPKLSPALKPSESDSAESADSGGKDKRAGIREVHNKLEKNRRAHLKECFENLRTAIPNMEDRKSKTSNLSILRGALRYIQVLTRKERELDHEQDRLVRQKIATQQRLDLLKIKNGMSTSEQVKLPTDHDDNDDDDDDDRLVVAEEKDIIVEVHKKKPDDDDDQASTSTASEAEEEERKSQAHSRVQSPLHQPVAPHLSHPDYPRTSVSTSFAALPSHHTRPSLPYTSSTSRVPGLSHSANEAMLRISALQEVQAAPPGESGRQRHASEEIRPLHHGTSISPRTTFLQMNQDKAPTIPVAGHIPSAVSHISPVVSHVVSPPAGKDMSVLVTQSASAMAGSISRQTVSQLLGKQPVVRQPVRRQLTVAQLPVIQSPMRNSQLFPRIMSTPPVRLGFNPASQSVIGASKPVVTVGINSLLAQSSVIQAASSHKTVISNGMVTSSAELTTVSLTAKQISPILTTPSPLTSPSMTSPLSTSILTTTAGPISKSLMTASVITQTLPVMSNAGHSPFIPPIALQSPATAGTSLLLPTANYIGLQHSMITQPFITPPFATATQPPHIRIATSTHVTPSSATSQPVVHPSVQPITPLGNSAISLALQAALPKNLPQVPTASFPSALGISSLASQSALLSTALSTTTKPKTLHSANLPAAPSNSAQGKAKSPTPGASSGGTGSRGSRNKGGINGKTDSQITTSKIAETMASLAGNTQSMAKNGHSTSTVNSRTSQQSLVVKL
ncbi:uncharacterized protein [Diadema antillarum]|uniref:uncharacterized protein n=1 Tax=Diadema antillarum TaxID=105358 RepID=UPI003A86BB98